MEAGYTWLVSFHREMEMGRYSDLAVCYSDDEPPVCRAKAA